MHYIKYEGEDGLSVKVPLYDDQIFTECLDCGKEIYLQQDELMHMLICGGDLAGTGTVCESCTEKRVGK